MSLTYETLHLYVCSRKPYLYMVTLLLEHARREQGTTRVLRL